MAFFGSLYTSAAGMEAQQRATSTISTNIANINTTGYKRSEMNFYELVASPNSRLPSGSGAANSISTRKILRADQLGAIQQTASATDAAIAGNGFFVVRSGSDTSLETLYTRAGNFSPDAEGYLRNSAGYILQGFTVDQDGNVGSTLVPLDIDILQTQVVPTTSASLSMNLNAGASAYDPHLFNTPSTLPADTRAAHFSRAVSIYDNNGTQRNVELEFRKIIGPMAHFTSGASDITISDVLVDNGVGPTPVITDGDTMEITDGTETLTINFVNATADISLNEVNTGEDLLKVINNFTGTGTDQLFEASLNTDGRLVVQALNPTSSLDITNSSATVLGAGGLNFITDPLDGDYAYDPDFDITADPTASIYPDQGDFPALANTTTPNPRNWWEITVTIPDPADPTGNNTVNIRQGLLNFDETGNLNATADANGDILIDLASTPIDFDLADTTDDSGFTIDITRFSQFTGEFSVISSDQNGSGVGTFSGVEINREGIVSAKFSTGESVNIYQIPLAHFTNTNALTEISGTAFRYNEDAGTITISAPGTEGTGFLATSSIENSNVDLSGEFGDLIVTQRAFSLNGQVLNAVDEMTRNLSQLI